jgi:hypothetical protein
MLSIAAEPFNFVVDVEDGLAEVFDLFFDGLLIRFSLQARPPEILDGVTDVEGSMPRNLNTLNT